VVFQSVVLVVADLQIDRTQVDVTDLPSSCGDLPAACPLEEILEAKSNPEVLEAAFDPELDPELDQDTCHRVRPYHEVAYLNGRVEYFRPKRVPSVTVGHSGDRQSRAVGAFHLGQSQEEAQCYVLVVVVASRDSSSRVGGRKLAVAEFPYWSFGVAYSPQYYVVVG